MFTYQLKLLMLLKSNMLLAGEKKICKNTTTSQRRKHKTHSHGRGFCCFCCPPSLSGEKPSHFYQLCGLSETYG